MLDEYGNEIIEEQAIDTTIINGYTIFGRYVNESRHIPYLYDGLKPSYRRLIQTAYEEKDRLLKTATITGLCMAKLHPHGDSIEKVVPPLVNMKIFSKQGSFGTKVLLGDDMPAAAPRYTEVKLNPVIRTQFDKIMKYVPNKDAYSYGNKEFNYMPFPLPLSLVFGAKGIGFGVATNIPPFTIESLYEAYKSDDPTKLLLNYGYKLGEDSEAGLRSLWETGRGALSIEIPIEEVWIEGEFGYLISCDPQIFKPNFGNINSDEECIVNWEKWGYVNITDLTDTKPKLFISRVKGKRLVTDEMIKEQLDSICKRRRGYYINVYNGITVGLIGIKKWLEFTITNYLNLMNTYKSENILALEYEFITWKYFRRVAELILDQSSGTEYSYEEIVDIVNSENNTDELTLDHVLTIGKKSINTLRNADSSSKCDAIRRAIDDFTDMDPKVETDEFIKEWSNSI